MRFSENFDSGINSQIGTWVVGVFQGVMNTTPVHRDLALNGSTHSARLSSSITNNFGVGDDWFYNAVYLFSVTANNYAMVTCRLSNVDACSVTYVPNTGIFALRRGGSGGTVLATSSPGLMPANVWHFLWFDLRAKNSSGSLGVYLDGNPMPVVSYVGDTTDAASDGWDQLYFQTWAEVYHDDMVTFTHAEKIAFANGTYPELFASYVPPTSDVANTFNSGGFASVDEATWSTGDYAESLTAGQELVCGVTGLAWTPAAVRGVVVQSFLARDGVIDQFGGILQSGGVKITVKQSCNLATTAALPAYIAAGTGPGKTLTALTTSVLTVDGVAVALNNRVLVKDEGGGTSVNNGIYKCTTEGTVSIAFVLTRATDFDNVGPDAEVDTGDVTYILAGSANMGKTFRLTTADPITVDTTALTFAEMVAYLPSKTGVGAASYVQAQWFFPLDPNGNVQWTYATAIAAKPGIQTQTAV